MEDDAPRRPGTRSESARPTRPPRPPAALFMEPTVPPVRRRPQPAEHRPSAAQPSPTEQPSETEQPSPTEEQAGAEQQAPRAERGPAHAAEPTAPAEPEPDSASDRSPAGTATARPRTTRKRTPGPAEPQITSEAAPPAKKAAPAKGTTAAKSPAAKSTRPAKSPATKTSTAAKNAAAKSTPATKKAAPAKKAGTVRKATPANQVAAPAKKTAASAKKVAAPTATTAASRPVTASVARPVPPWWARVPADPAEVPGWLAHAAVERYGTSAGRYVRWLRETYPHAGPDALARIAVARFHRRPWYTALAGPAGIAGLVATQAELVLHVAAAYGHDATDPARVPELVALIPSRGLVGSLAGRFAGRLIPGAGLVAGLLADRGALDDVARRAIAHYGAGSGQER